jgi:hypothetical protein
MEGGQQETRSIKAERTKSKKAKNKQTNEQNGRQDLGLSIRRLETSRYVDETSMNAIVAATKRER